MLNEHTAQIENWRDIPGFEGFYQASDHGSIKSLVRAVPMSDGRTYRVKEKMLKQSWNGAYRHVILSSSGREETMLVHRLVLLAFVGSCPDGMEARHLDGNTENNRLDNLEWGTPKENHEDRVRHKTARYGRAFRLSSGQRQRIRKLKARGELNTAMRMELAKEYGVCFGTICRYVRIADR